MASPKEKKIFNFPTHYTEDGLPVYTIYLSHIPRSITENELKEYFGSFGVVKSVKTIVKHNANNLIFRYGFVTFKEAQAATKALKNPSHPAISNRMKVKPADSWKQPRPINQCSEDATADDDNDINSISILNLNDDCLLHIMSFLSNCDKMKLAIAHSRFRDVYGIVIKIEKLLDLNDIIGKFTLMEARHILSQFGVHIRRVKLNALREPESYKRILEFVAMFCYNIEELDFEYVSRIYFGNYHRLLSTTKHLTTLKMSNCDLSDRTCSVISNLTTLQRLNLSNNQDITGQSLHNLKNLIDLNLKNCEGLKSNHFIDICKSVKLKSLDIRGCYQLYDNAFCTLITTQENLESLIVSNLDYSCQEIAKLPNLKHLRIQRIHNNTGAYFHSRLLQELASNRKETLESLELFGQIVNLTRANKEHICDLSNLKVLALVDDNCVDDNFLKKIAKNCLQLNDINITGSNNISEDGVNYLIEHTKKLRFLNLSSCLKFRDINVFKWIKILRKKEMSEPLTLFIEDTKIAPCILKHKKFKGNEDIIRLQFKCRGKARYRSNEELVNFFCEDEFSDDYDYINMLLYSSDEDYDIYDFDFVINDY